MSDDEVSLWNGKGETGRAENRLGKIVSQEWKKRDWEWQSERHLGKEMRWREGQTLGMAVQRKGKTGRGKDDRRGRANVEEEDCVCYNRKKTKNRRYTEET